MKKINAARALFGAWAVLAVLLALAVGAAAEQKNLVNGGFEDGPAFNVDYQQPQQGVVPGWSTTATDQKIELFRENTGTYINGVKLSPGQGSYAAELNANEESTLYQALDAVPSSLYEWSLYHGARSARDTMALIIGPDQVDANQGCLLSKPDRNGRDQFMQMVDWLMNPANYDYVDDNYSEVSSNTTGFQGYLYKQGEPIILYSKKFGPKGTFEDNAAGNAFSLTPSTIYTEQWYIWLMRDKCASSGKNPWTHYGAPEEVQASGSTTNGGDEYYRYLVPAGQEKTIFGFVSVDSKGQDKTFGNFLDCVNFEIFHNVTASRTAHGTAKVVAQKAEDGETLKTVAEIDAPEGDKASSYVPDGATMTLTANIAASDVSSVVFAGVFYKRNGEAAQFISSGDSRWTASDPTSGGKQYTMSLTLEKGCDLHFVFIKSPTITYDSNGGDPYNCGQSTTDQNVYSFQPTTGESGTILIEPYTSHAATKTDGGTANPDWRFTGWLMMDDSDNTTTGNSNMKMIDDTTGEHLVACNYSFAAGTVGGSKKQEFIVIGRNDPSDPLPSFKGTPGTENVGGTSYSVKRWSANGGQVYYNNSASGLTFIAQWRWRQTYIPKVKSGSSWVPSNAGGSIAVSTIPTGTTTVTPVEASKLEAPVAQEYKDIGQCYFAEQQETMSVTATANSGYEFEGWYDTAGNLVTTKQTLSYVVGKGDVNVYEARFVGTAEQRYIRQIPDENGNWIEVTGENVAALDHTEYFVSPGTMVDSTPKADTEDYVFKGWYKQENGSYVKVTDNRTLSYAVTGNATYYARFVPRVRFKVRYVDGNGNVTSPPVTGEVYGTVSQTEAAELPGTPISSTASPATGYRFVGWYDGTGANKTLIGSDATYTGAMPPVGTTYYAMFTAGNNSRYKVQHIKVKPDKVKPDDSTEVASEAIISSVPTGTAVSAQSIPIPGYTYRTDSFTMNGKDYVSNPTGIVRGDGQLVLRLYYTPTNTAYRIEYYKLDAQGKETLADTESPTAQTDAVVSVTGYENRYASEGYSFAAHYGKNKLTGTVTVDPVLVLKVYYKPLEHTVSFDMHGFGAQVPPQTVPHNGEATRPEDPVELGYAFGGWYTDDTYATPYDFATPVTQDIVIHAKWNMIWPVDFDMQGHGEPVDRQLVEDGKKATRPAPEPTAEGYVFKGWYTEAACQKKFDFANTPINQATTVYAMWTANVTVTKEWEGGNPEEVQVRLLKDGKRYDPMPKTDPDSAGQSTPQTCEQPLNTTNRWTHTWTNLPADSTYTVEEVAVPEDCTAVYEKLSTNSWKITNVRDKQMAVTVTNTHRSDTIGMVIRKEWDDAGNRNRPGSVRVRIVNAKTNAVVQEHELNAGNSWTWNVAGLPKRQDGGETVRYLVQEVGEYAGYSAACEIVVEADGSYTVKLTNVLTGKLDIGGEKLWDDGGDRDGLRPDSVQLKIYQNAIAEQNLVRIVQVTAAPNSGVNDPWTWSVQDLPVYDGFGRPITYIVVEDPVPAGYADPGPRRITVTP